MINKNFCVSAYKVLSKSANPEKYKHLRNLDANQLETVSAYADALKDMVVIHTQLIITEEYDNNHILRSLSLANRLLSDFSKGKISKISKISKIEKINKVKEIKMNIFQNLKSLFVAQDALQIAEAKAAEYASKAEAKKVEKLKIAKETSQIIKKENRLKTAVSLVKTNAETFVVVSKELELMEKNLQGSKKAYADTVSSSLDKLLEIDSYVNTSLGLVEEVIVEVQEEVQEEIKVEVQEEIKVEVQEEIKVEVQEEIKVEVQEEVKEEVIVEVQKEVKEEVKVEVQEEVKEEVIVEVQKEVKEEVIVEVQKEVKEEVQEEVIVEVQKEVKEEVQEEVQEEVKEEVIVEVQKEVKEEVKSLGKGFSNSRSRRKAARRQIAADQVVELTHENSVF